MDSDQLRVALILSVLAGLLVGFIGFVGLSGVTARTVSNTRTPTPTVVLSPTSTDVPLLPSRRPATMTPTPTTPPTATLPPTDTPPPTATLVIPTPTATIRPTDSLFPVPEVTVTLPALPTEVPPIETINWVIVTGSYELLQEALADSVRFQQAGYEITLFLRDDVFRGAIVGYETISDARDPLEEVRLTLEADAYLRDLRVWCPERVLQSGYLACER